MPVPAELWPEVRGVVEQALDLSAGERAGYVERTCAGRPEVRAAVQRLLDAESEVDGDALVPPRLLRAWLVEGAAEAVEGSIVGGFRLRRILATGGMGVVYEAEQDAPRRLVALKMMRFGLGTPAAVERFRWEIDVAARLQHPNVASVFEAGTHTAEIEGCKVEVPFFAMELVEDARTLVGHAADAALALRDRLRLFVDACAGVQEGHRHGLIHCDLKPGNLLVDRAGRVKVIDFGIARAVGLAAGPRQPSAGTARYMSPEQRGAGVEVLDVRADVFALGSVLAEMVGGESDAELRAIVARATEHDRASRYGAAGELGDDVARYLAGEPVSAMPATLGYRARKLAARHRIAAAFAVVALGAVVIGLAFAWLSWTEALRQRERAEREATRSEGVAAFLREILVAPHPYHDGRDVPLREVLERTGPGIDGAFEGDPAAAAMLHEIVGVTLRSLGSWEIARGHLRAAFEAECGDEFDPRRRWKAGEQLAQLLMDSGEQGRAAEVTRALVVIVERAFMPDADEALSSWGLHALALARAGDSEQAVAAQRRVLRLTEARHGGDSVATIGHMNTLAAILVDAGELQEAEQLAGRARRLMVEKFGEQHPNTLVTVHNHAAILVRLGRPADAEPPLRAVIEERARVLGAGHPYTAESRLWLGRALLAQERAAAAAEVLEAGVEALEVSGEPSNARVPLEVEMAMAMAACGRSAEALALLRAVLARLAEDPAAPDAARRALVEQALATLEK